MNTYFIVTGRMCFDDEDSAFIYEVETAEEAVECFRQEMWEENRDPDFLEECPSPPPCDEVEEDCDIIYILWVFRVESDNRPTIKMHPY